MIKLRDSVDLPAQAKAAAISSIYENAALQVIFDLMEDCCTEAENELIGEPPWSPAVMHKQAIAYAQNRMLVAVREAIDFHVAEFRQTDVKNSMANRK